MATKNYMINDKWLDLDKQNIVELQSVDGVLDSLKVNGSEIETPAGKITITENGTDIDVAQYALADVNVEGGGGSSDLTWILPEQTVTVVDQPVEITGMRFDLIPTNTMSIPLKCANEAPMGILTDYLSFAVVPNSNEGHTTDGRYSIYEEDGTTYFVSAQGETVVAGEYTISIALF